jgi:formylmethanofuran dehydrogenase subunit E
MGSDTLASQGVNDEMSTHRSQRVKVHIRCRKCGESFILRGVRDSKGHIETGFKRCLCDNEDDFDIEPIG